MKTLLTNLMTSAVLLCTLGGGLEAQTIRIHASVPFAWQMEGRQLNAGTVVISRESMLPVLTVEDKTSGRRSYVSASPASSPNTACRLVFHRYGNQYFLAEIDAPGVTAKNLPVTAAEKQASEAANQTASTGTSHRNQMTTVFVNIDPAGK